MHHRRLRRPRRPSPRFWNEALQWGGVAVSPRRDGRDLRAAGRAGLYLEFIRVPEAKAGKNRLHLGCSVRRARPARRRDRPARGARAPIAWEEEFPPEIAATYRNVILRDVEGNEFCLGARAPTP